MKKATMLLMDVSATLVPVRLKHSPIRSCQDRTGTLRSQRRGLRNLAGKELRYHRSQHLSGTMIRPSPQDPCGYGYSHSYAGRWLHTERLTSWSDKVTQTRRLLTTLMNFSWAQADGRVLTGRGVSGGAFVKACASRNMSSTPMPRAKKGRTWRGRGGTIRHLEEPCSLGRPLKAAPESSST